MDLLDGPLVHRVQGWLGDFEHLRDAWGHREEADEMAAQRPPTRYRIYEINIAALELRTNDS